MENQTAAQPAAAPTAQPAPQKLAFPQVPRGEAAKFAKVWHHNGVNIILQDSALKFAEDFANVVLRNFVQSCAAQAAAMAKAAKPEEKKSLIVEA